MTAHKATFRLLLLLLVWAPLITGCPADDGGRVSRDEERKLQALRNTMVETQIMARGVEDTATLKAMLKVPRHRFVPALLKWKAYGDHPLPIGAGQTISQPYIVAFMTEQLKPQADDRILEVGTGSGYQAAVLAEIVKEIHSIEIVQSLGQKAKKVLQTLDYGNVHVRVGDGYKGWPEAAPFDAVIVTCAPDHIPQPLIDQLAAGGRMIIPVGPENTVQELVLLRKGADGLERQSVLPVRFVPMTGDGVKRQGRAPDFRPAPREKGDHSAAAISLTEQDHEKLRERMVQEQLRDRGITAEHILAAVETVPRHRFVRPEHRHRAYEDCSLLIDREETISSPYLTAFMSEKLQAGPGDSVLEVGTGSGYQAAVLAEFVGQVYTVEIIEPLGLKAEKLLESLGYDNIHVRIGDGYRGWPEAAPFDAIMVTCAPDHVPEPLVRQLKFGGKLLIPVENDDGAQELVFVRKTAGGLVREAVMPVEFEPMKAGKEPTGR